MAARLPQDASKMPQEAHRRPPGTLWDLQKMKKSIGKISVSRLYAFFGLKNLQEPPKSPQESPKTPQDASKTP